MRYKLHLKSYPREVSHVQEEWLMEGVNAVIGRGEHCHIHLPDPRRLVSTNHATIRVISGKCAVVDMSANGTKLNDEPLEKGEEYSLQDHDILDCCDFVLEFSPLANDRLECVATEEIGKTVPLGALGGNRFELAAESLRVLYRDITDREPDVRQELLLGNLRSQMQNMNLSEAGQFLRYVEAAFPEPEMQCAHVLHHVTDESPFDEGGLVSRPSELRPERAVGVQTRPSDAVGRTATGEHITFRQQAVLTHLFEFLVTYEKGRQQFQKEFFGKDLTRYLGGTRNHIKWAVEAVEIERYLFGEQEDQVFAQRLKELDEVLLAFHRHPLGILQGFYKSLDALLDQFSPTLIQQEIQKNGGHWFFPFRAQAAWRRVQAKYWALNEDRQGLVKKFLTPYVEEGYCEIVQKVDR